MMHNLAFLLGSKQKGNYSRPEGGGQYLVQLMIPTALSSEQRGGWRRTFTTTLAINDT